jgi:cell division protein FtsB
MDKEIATKQEKLIVLTRNNDAAYENIKDTYDLDYVYHQAVEKLGMVYPNKNTVISYQGSVDDYVRKNESIPK